MQKSAAHTFSKPGALNIDDAAAYVALSVTGIRRLIAAGTFPRSRTLSGQRVGFLVRELDAWLDSRPVSDMLPVGSATE
ncbi:AlpA family phage regulatory protein [Paraburkholderia aspalathi]|uniref:helix-turn-helix transcriptional regulator n=1 Tax=Paraburkholderia nemoris TaxID=2793076 RepID=UPI00190B3929|nr:AlpA family phage regulatory protein [Paraburkholderia aspalathi]